MSKESEREVRTRLKQVFARFEMDFGKPLKPDVLLDWFKKRAVERYVSYMEAEMSHWSGNQLDDAIRILGKHGRKKSGK